MSAAVRFGGAAILAVIFAIVFYVLLDGVALAIFIGLCAAAAWLLVDIFVRRRSGGR